jgi:tRNA (mo5U34)-methyltransferase
LWIYSRRDLAENGITLAFGACEFGGALMRADTTHRIEELKPWFHNLHLPSGEQTAPEHPLGDFPSFKWQQIAPHLPADLSGWRAIDIGCNAGFYSFELARRGATITAIDIDAHYLQQARWAAEQFDLISRITFKQMQVYDLARSEERYDLVWFMGVFYHLRYPFLALNIVAQKVERLMVFQTLTTPGDEVLAPENDPDLDEREILLERGWPKMSFIEGRLAGDPTNWWIPNHACVQAMLRSSGLKVLANPAHEVYLCEPAANCPSELTDYCAAELRCAVGIEARQKGGAVRQE